MRGTPLIVYPHGFSATWVWDLMGNNIEATASFVPGTGQRELLERFGYRAPVKVCGWPGEPVRKVEGVVFAPHHPLGSGYLPPEHRDENARAFRLLLGEGHKLTVRFVGSLESNGLWHDSRAEYVEGEMGGEIIAGDVVVGGGTYAAHCLAADVPVVMYHQEREWRLASEWSPNYVQPPGWEKHMKFTHYPLDLAPGVVAKATTLDPDVVAWRSRFMPPFDAEGFAESVEGAVQARTGVLAA